MDDPARSPREHHTDFEWLEATLRFRPEIGLVKGEVEHTFSWIRDGIDTLFLDAPKIKIQAVESQGKPLSFKMTEAGVIIRFPEPSKTGRQEKITLRYEALPRKGLYFIGWQDAGSASRRQIWSQGQGIDNRYWLPMYDEMNDKIRTRLRIYFDTAYAVLSNGKLARKELQKDGTYLWEYVMEKPHAPYLIMLGIGRYTIKSSTASSGIPLHMYMYPDRLNDFETTFKNNKEIFDFMEKEVGVPYPWPAYSQIPVQEYIYGAMENTSATVFGDFFIVDKRAFHDRNYIAVNAHELAHQWFGDLVTARSARHHWLQESFATYYNWLYEREFFGQDHYDWNRRQAQVAALNEGTKNTFPIAHSQAGSTRHYPKGAFVLHMLSAFVGKENYQRAIRRYLQTHAYGNVTSDDLLKAFHDELGLGLEWFWDQWIYGGGEPKLEVSETTETGWHIVQIQQVQDGAGVARPFRLPLQMDMYYENGQKQRLTHWMDSIKTEIRVPLRSGARVVCVVVDPGNTLLRDLRHEKSTETLKFQTLKAEHMLDRWDALVALREKEFPQKKEFLQEVFKRETFWALKGEAIKQLMKNFPRDAAVQKLWKSALRSSDNALRKEAVAALETVESSDLFEDLLALADIPDASYGLLESALRLLAKRNTGLAKNFREKIWPLCEHPNAASLKVALWEVTYGLEPQKAAQAIDELLALAASDKEFRTRIAAFQALSRLRYFGEKALDSAVQAYLSTNMRLSGAVATYLKEGLRTNQFSRRQLEIAAERFPSFEGKEKLLEELWLK
ncbi:MAG: M1 family metallopeptidase [Flavobacteriales bacterium]|nr:M1 family metallopeptidase [Flavobacteriales bacterium]